MHNNELEFHIEFLLSAALKKCGNAYDAEDLTQETLLAALAYHSNGNEIKDVRAWLLTILNRRYYDMLRKKYRQPTISMGEDFDIFYSTDDENLRAIEISEEACELRKAVAFLAKIYREVIVKHYMNGESIAQIASELNLPEGTVKSRLHLGRNQLKKGFDTMEKYQKQSYEPVTLKLNNSGNWGINGEPMSLINNDLTAQNILWIAYEKPLTIEEISQAIGIPSAYVEPIVEKLLNGELMKKNGTNRYYTDFIIYTLEDKEHYIPEQKNLVHEHFDLFWNAIDNGLSKIRTQDFYTRCNFDAKNSLEMYFAFNCLDYGIYTTFSNIFNAKQVFPDRPNGGKWIAFGNVFFKEFNPSEHIELMAHTYSGERWERFTNYADSKLIEMHVYGADGFPAYSYRHSPEYTFFAKHEELDAVFTKLLYIIHTDTNPETVGFNPEYLRSIPWLTKCKILRTENNKPIINIPVLSGKEASDFWNICKEVRQAFADDIKELLAQYFKGKKKPIPSHLDSVPLQKQYMHVGGALLFATIREAIKRDKLYNGNYDDDSNGINQPPCPMLLVIEK